MSVAQTKPFLQAAHGLAKFNVTRWSGASVVKAQANSLANVDDGTLVIAVPSVDELDLFAGEGFLEEPAHGIAAPGSRLWLSQAVAGAITTTEPSSGVKRFLGYIPDADHIHWAPLPAQSI